MADGGITALGTNITLMGLVGVVVGWLRLRRRSLAVLPQADRHGRPGRRGRRIVSVPVAALAFTAALRHRRHRPGGPPSAVLAAMLVVAPRRSALGEAVITGLVVASVIGVRPDLVYGARPSSPRRELEIRTPRREPGRR